MRDAEQKAFFDRIKKPTKRLVGIGIKEDASTDGSILDLWLQLRHVNATYEYGSTLYMWLRFIASTFLLA